jgi:hypothetical protein
VVRRSHFLGAGAAVAAIYLALVLLTLHGSSTPVRPLFDGFAPVTKYRWVAPPGAFAAGNQRPSGTTATVRLGPDGSRHAGIATDDGQLILALGDGAIAPHGADDRVRVQVEPLDGTSLSLPDRLRANGNAYRITMTYVPSGAAVTALADPGTITLGVPELSRGLYRFAGGRAAAVASEGVPPALVQITARLDRPGTYLSGTDLPLPRGPSDSTRDHTVLIAVIVGAVVLVAVVAAGLVARRRRRATSPRTGSRPA